MQFFIRADSSTKIGIGHIMRCLNLAKTLKKHNCEVIFITQNLDGNINSHIKHAGFKYIEIPSLEDLSFLSPTSSFNLIVDHYDLGLAWEKTVKKHVNKLIVIDDFTDREHECDIYINPNDLDVDTLSNHPLMYKGLRYALINENFNKITIRVAESVKNVLISMGGSDPTSELFKCATAFENEPNIHFHIIPGTSNLRSNELKHIHSNPQFIYHEHSDKLPELLAKMDIGITAAGSMLKEFLCAGLPTIVISNHKNQIDIAKNLSEQKAILYLGHHIDVTPSIIRDTFLSLEKDYQLRQSLHLKGKKVVDGLGIERLVKKLTVPNIDLRKIEINDARCTYEWRTNPATLKYSHNKESFDYDTHISWLKAVINDPKKALLMASSKGNNIGVIRFDMQSDLSCIVSIYLNPLYHGKSYGSYIIQSGIRWILQNNYAPKNLIAKIYGDNIQSVRIFEAAGFVSDTLKNTMVKYLK